MYDDYTPSQPVRFAGSHPNPQQTIIVRVYPAKDGRGRFDVYLGGKFVVTSRTPFYSSARWLMASRKYPADTIMIMRHGNSPKNAMIGLIGALAEKTVSETDKSGPKQVRYVPHPKAVSRASGGDS